MIEQTINLREIMGLPLVQEALQTAAKKKDQAELQKRIEILDGIEQAENEMLELEKELVGARKKLEDVIEQMQKERGRVGALEGRKSTASRRYNQLFRDLRNFGERDINDARLVIDCALRGCEEEIARWEGARFTMNSVQRAELLKKAAIALPDLREALPKLRKAQEQIGKLAMSHKSPVEVAAQSRAILEMAGLTQ